VTHESEAAARRFGRNLWTERRRSGLSQEQVSKFADLHRTTPSLLENGLREPRLMTIVKLAAVLETTPETLLRGIDWLVVTRPRSTGAVLIDGRPVAPGTVAG